VDQCLSEGHAKQILGGLQQFQLDLKFSRTAANQPQVSEAPPSALEPLHGTWTLNRELSQKVWDQIQPPDSAKNYLEKLTPRLEGMLTIQIQGNVFSFQPEQTAEPFDVVVEMEVLAVEPSRKLRFKFVNVKLP